jgi:hypothetical protein
MMAVLAGKLSARSDATSDANCIEASKAALERQAPGMPSAT